MADSEIRLIETPEEWLDIIGETPKKDMLFIVEVFAEWCGPSQAALSTYRKIKDQNEQKKFKLCKICASMADDEALAEQKEPLQMLEKIKIEPRPTFYLIKDGELVATVAGVSMPTLEKCAPAASLGPRTCCAPYARAALPHAFVCVHERARASRHTPRAAPPHPARSPVLSLAAG